MKNVFFFVAMALGMCCNNSNAQSNRQFKVESDGFSWYLVTNGSYQGAQNADGRTIVPCSFAKVWYINIADGWFLVRDNADPQPHKGAFEKDGKNTIPLSRGYTDVQKVSESDGYYYKIEKNGRTGACDANGREIIAPQYESLVYLDSEYEFSYRSSSGWIKTGVSLLSGSSYSSNNDYVFNLYIS